jgi:hypothetical protein
MDDLHLFAGAARATWEPSSPGLMKNLSILDVAAAVYMVNSSTLAATHEDDFLATQRDNQD